MSLVRIRALGGRFALTLAAAGADIAAVDLFKNEQTDELIQEITKMGCTCLPLQADVSKEEDVNAFIKDTLAQFKRIDILVNNAGITRDGLIDAHEKPMIGKL